MTNKKNTTQKHKQRGGQKINYLKNYVWRMELSKRWWMSRLFIVAIEKCNASKSDKIEAKQSKNRMNLQIDGHDHTNKTR